LTCGSRRAQTDHPFVVSRCVPTALLTVRSFCPRLIARTRQVSALRTVDFDAFFWETPPFSGCNHPLASCTRTWLDARFRSVDSTRFARHSVPACSCHKPVSVTPLDLLLSLQARLPATPLSSSWLWTLQVTHHTHTHGAHTNTFTSSACLRAGHKNHPGNARRSSQSSLHALMPSLHAPMPPWNRALLTPLLSRPPLSPHDTPGLVGTQADGSAFGEHPAPPAPPPADNSVGQFRVFENLGRDALLVAPPDIVDRSS